MKKYKLYILFFIFLIVFTLKLNSQNDSTITKYKNVVYLELLGNSITSGLYLEREFAINTIFKSDNLNLRIGGGYLGIPSISTSIHLGIGDFKQFEIGLGYQYVLTPFADNSKREYPVVNIGYKIVRENSNFKLYFMPIYNFIGFNFSIYRF